MASDAEIKDSLKAVNTTTSLRVCMSVIFVPLFVFYHCLSCYFLFLFLLMLSKYAWQKGLGEKALFAENHP